MTDTPHLGVVLPLLELVVGRRVRVRKVQTHHVPTQHTHTHTHISVYMYMQWMSAFSRARTSCCYGCVVLLWLCCVVLCCVVLCVVPCEYEVWLHVVEEGARIRVRCRRPTHSVHHIP